MNTTPRFTLGRTFVTPCALEQLSAEDIRKAISRHAYGDWGDCCEEDREANNRALRRHKALLGLPLAHWSKVLGDHRSGPLSDDGSVTRGVLNASRVKVALCDLVRDGH